MTADDTTPPEGDETPAGPGERLPDDHPVVKALAKANKEAEAARLKVKEFEDAQKGELEKLQDQIAERDRQLADLPAATRAQAIRFASLATQMGFVDPEDALTLSGDLDLSDAAAVKAALEDLAQRKPHLVRTDPSPKVPQRPRPKGGAPDHDDGNAPKGKERAAAALRAYSQQ